jgi:hypothetical protein
MLFFWLREGYSITNLNERNIEDDAKLCHFRNVFKKKLHSTYNKQKSVSIHGDYFEKNDKENNNCLQMRCKLLNCQNSIIEETAGLSVPSLFYFNRRPKI